MIISVPSIKRRPLAAPAVRPRNRNVSQRVGRGNRAHFPSMHKQPDEEISAFNVYKKRVFSEFDRTSERSAAASARAKSVNASIEETINRSVEMIAQYKDTIQKLEQTCTDKYEQDI